MSLRVFQPVKLAASGRPIHASIDLWNSEAIQSSAKGEHGQAVRDVIEEQTKKFITDWNLDNK
jgi:hypothetical protein